MEKVRAADQARKATHRAGLDDETMEEVRAEDRARKATEEARASNRERMATDEARAADRARKATEEARAADRARKTNKRYKRSIQPRDGLRAKEVMTGTLIVPYIGDTEDGIGKMDVECPYCKALKFKNETPSMCCNNGNTIAAICKTSTTN